MFTRFLNFSGSEMESQVLRHARPIWSCNPLTCGAPQLHRTQLDFLISNLSTPTPASNPQV